MTSTSIHPPGDKIKKAITEFSFRLENDNNQDRDKLLQKIIIEFDLSPKEADFLRRHCKQ